MLDKLKELKKCIYYCWGEADNEVMDDITSTAMEIVDELIERELTGIES